jgi:zinc-binding in reverse transcriptase
LVRFWGVKDFAFQSIWSSHRYLKINIFLWRVRQNKILTKNNLSKRGYQGDIHFIFIFSNDAKIIDHLLWSWIANYNNFHFLYQNIEELWHINVLYHLNMIIFVKWLEVLFYGFYEKKK